MLSDEVVREVENLLLSEVREDRIAQIIGVPERMVLAIYDSPRFQQQVQGHMKRSRTRAMIKAANRAPDMVSVMHELAEDPDIPARVRLDAAKSAAALAGVVEGQPAQQVNVAVTHSLQDRVDQILEASFEEL